jgi:hypothetical protein
MGGKKVERQQSDFNFSEIIKKAYEIGVNDSEVTIQKLLDEIKTDLKKLIVN